ncbi:MAG: Holliday junction resolvase RuvX, partial [Bacteroidetes bacterium]|nr:Holliday junction resolvase RuvX [Bacteroidota bacterium]
MINRRTLAIDYGERRVGLALSDELGIIASGIGTLGNDETLLPRLLEIIRDRDVARVIIGLPLTLKAEQGASALNVQGFVPRLEAACGLP